MASRMLHHRRHAPGIAFHGHQSTASSSPPATTALRLSTLIIVLIHIILLHTLSTFRPKCIPTSPQFAASGRCCVQDRIIVCPRTRTRRGVRTAMYSSTIYTVRTTAAPWRPSLIRPRAGFDDAAVRNRARAVLLASLGLRRQRFVIRSPTAPRWTRPRATYDEAVVRDRDRTRGVAFTSFLLRVQRFVSRARAGDRRAHVVQAALYHGAVRWYRVPR